MTTEVPPEPPPNAALLSLYDCTVLSWLGICDVGQFYTESAPIVLNLSCLKNLNK